MNLLILGATGGCGRWATRIAAGRGHALRLLARDPSRLDTPTAPPASTAVIEGSVLDAPTLERSLVGIDAVVSCLGQRRRHPRNPWSRITSPHDLNERVAMMLARLMPDAGVSRLVAISAGGVGDSVRRISPFNQWLFNNSSIGVAYRDLERMERVLLASDLDWHAVRPTTLTNGKHTGSAREVGRYGPFTRIARADVASWMLDVIDGDASKSRVRTPMIATRGGRSPVESTRSSSSAPEARSRL